MKYLLSLIKINVELSFAEVKSIFLNAVLVKDFAIVDSKGFERLAFVREGFEILFECNLQNLNKKINSSQWGSPFAVRVYGDFISESDLADLIWGTQNNPKVDLINPMFDYHFFSFDGKVFATRKIYSNNEDFEARRAHLRPGGSSVSLHPRLARAMVNLTGVLDGEVFDPCVGTGGLLLEAELMGIKSRGMDISSVMLERAGKVLSKSILLNGDALELGGNFDYIVTDLPYGRNTATKDVEGFINDFLMMVSRVLGVRAVVSFPMGIDVVFPKSLNIVFDFSYYIHKSLSKRIVVIERLSCI